MNIADLFQNVRKTQSEIRKLGRTPDGCQKGECLTFWQWKPFLSFLYLLLIFNPTREKINEVFDYSCCAPFGKIGPSFSKQFFGYEEFIFYSCWNHFWKLKERSFVIEHCFTLAIFMQEFLEATILSSELDSFTFRFLFKQDKVKETFLTFYLKILWTFKRGFWFRMCFWVYVSNLFSWNASLHNVRLILSCLILFTLGAKCQLLNCPFFDSLIVRFDWWIFF